MLRLRICRACGAAAAFALLTVGLGAVRAPRAMSEALNSFAPTRVDHAVLQVLARVAPQSQVVAAIEVDVDHDGDLDVVARTADDVVAVWVNVGHNRFERYRPRSTPLVLASAAVGGQESPGQVPMTVTRAGAAACLIASTVSAPPVPSAARPAPDHAACPDDLNTPSSGRAPPSVPSP